MKHTNNIKTEYFRNCPECNKTIYYSNKRGLKLAIERNKKCNGCARTGRKLTNDQCKLISINTKKAMNKSEIREKFLKNNNDPAVCKSRSNSLKKYYESKDISGENNPFYGRKHTKETKEKMKLKAINRIVSLETRKKHRKNTTGKNNPFYGKTHTPENRLKFRLNLIERKKFKGPNYNKTACLYFNWLNMYNNWTGQHALNGGEFLIKGLGYWVDYYEPNLNIVIEWDEEFHYNLDQLNSKDIERQNNIIKELNCEFYRIRQKDFKIIKIN